MASAHVEAESHQHKRPGGAVVIPALTPRKDPTMPTTRDTREAITTLQRCVAFLEEEHARAQKRADYYRRELAQARETLDAAELAHAKGAP